MTSPANALMAFPQHCPFFASPLSSLCEAFEDSGASISAAT
jgi:hypothetical protein